VWTFSASRRASASRRLCTPFIAAAGDPSSATSTYRLYGFEQPLRGIAARGVIDARRRRPDRNSTACITPGTRRPKGNLRRWRSKDGVAGNGGMTRPSARRRPLPAQDAHRAIRRRLVFGSLPRRRCPLIEEYLGGRDRDAHRPRAAKTRSSSPARFTQMLATTKQRKTLFENVKRHVTTRRSCTLLHDVSNQPGRSAAGHGGDARTRQPRELSFVDNQSKEPTTPRWG